MKERSIMIVGRVVIKVRDPVMRHVDAVGLIDRGKEFSQSFQIFLARPIKMDGVRFIGPHRFGRAVEQFLQLLGSMKKASKRLVKHAVEIFQGFPHLDATFQTDVRLDQIVIGPNFPSRIEITPQLFLFFRRDPSPLKVSLTRHVSLDLRTGQPAKLFVPNISLGFDLRKGKGSDPFASQSHKPQNLPNLGVIRVMQRRFTDQIIGITRKPLMQGSA